MNVLLFENRVMSGNMPLWCLLHLLSQLLVKRPINSMETVPRFKISSERLEKPGIELTTPGLQGELLYHYTAEASG